MAGYGGAGLSAENQAAIRANKADLFELDSMVMNNKHGIYAERSMIEENRALIAKNYAAAFLGNRQEANTNTDEIFKNRKAILDGLPADTPVKVNFNNSMANEAKVDFLEHRSGLNSRVESVSEEMSKINALLIEVNHHIMENNAGIVAFNAKNIELNNKLLDGTISAADATPESNAARVKSNSERIAKIKGVAEANKGRIATLLEKVNANRVEILKNTDAIYQRRAEINANRVKMLGNAKKISDKLRAG